MPRGHYETKIIELQEKLKKERLTIRQLRQRNKELSASRLYTKRKYKALQLQYSGYKRTYRISQVVSPCNSISGHKYDLKSVCLCISLYAFAGCSFRGVGQVLLYLQLEWGICLGDLPSKSSVENWVQKLGYYEYMQYGFDSYTGDYSIIIDESMVVGQQRMMVVLGMEALKKGAQASTLGEVRLLQLCVKPSWDWVAVSELLKKVNEKMGRPPLYVISDGCGNLRKGISAAGLLRICDVGHEICKLVEQTYRGNETSQAFSQAVAGVKFREVMKETAYLLPPKQRSVARFMNFSGIVDWASNMLTALPRLKAAEQAVFGWLTDYTSLIVELTAVFEMTHLMLKKIKNEGLCFQNILYCMDICKDYVNKTPQKLIAGITEYFETEKDKLPDAATVWNASADVIESLFGKYKARSAPNKLNGVTPLVLSLCVHTHFQEQYEALHQEIKKALEGVSMADLDNWKQDHLIENQIVKRIKTLKK